MLGGEFDQQCVCDEANDELSGKIPFVVSYIAAGWAKRNHNPPLNDCNVADPDLCTYGAAFVSQNLSTILEGVYEVHVEVVAAEIPRDASGARGKLRIATNDLLEPIRDLPLFAMGRLAAADR